MSMIPTPTLDAAVMTAILEKRLAPPRPPRPPIAIDRAWARKVYRLQRKLIADLKAIRTEDPDDTPADLVPLLRPEGMRAGSSRYRYVAWSKDRRKFVVQLPKPGDVGTYRLGDYPTEDEAARAILAHTGGVVPEPRIGQKRNPVFTLAAAKRRWGRNETVTGVYPLASGKFEGKFTVGSVRHHCGTHDTEAQAIEAVRARRAELEAEGNTR